MGHVGPTFNKIIIKNNNNNLTKETGGIGFDILFFYLLFSLASLFDLRKSDLQNSSGQEAKCSTQRGLRMGTKNTGFRRVFN